MKKKKIVIIIISIIIIVSIILALLYWDFNRVIEKPLDIPEQTTGLKELYEKSNFNVDYSENIPQGYTIESTTDSVVVTIYRNKSLIKDVTIYKFENDECTEILTEAHYETKSMAYSISKYSYNDHKRKGNVIYTNKFNDEVTDTKDELFERLKNTYDKIAPRIN